MTRKHGEAEADDGHKGVTSFARLSWVFVLAWCSMLLAAGAVWKWFPSALEELGMFGDSFGVVTGLVTAMALVSSVFSLRIQRDELAATRVEMRDQRKEMTTTRKVHLLQHRIELFKIRSEYAERERLGRKATQQLSVGASVDLAGRMRAVLKAFEEGNSVAASFDLDPKLRDYPDFVKAIEDIAVAQEGLMKVGALERDLERLRVEDEDTEAGVALPASMPTKSLPADPLLR